MLQRGKCSQVYCNNICNNSTGFGNKCPPIRGKAKQFSLLILRTAIQALNKNQEVLYVRIANDHQDISLGGGGSKNNNTCNAIHFAFLKFYKYKCRYVKHLKNTNKLVTVVDLWGRTGLGVVVREDFVCSKRFVFFSPCTECVHVLLM